MLLRYSILCTAVLLSDGVNASTLLTSFSTASMNSGFVSSGIPGSWDCGEVTVGPQGGSSDTTSCGTGLSDNYTNNATDFLRLPSFDISSAVEPYLMFTHWWDIESGDEGVVERLLADGTWEAVELVYGYPGGNDHLSGDGGWTDAWVDLSTLEDTSELRFSLRSNQGVTGAGWFVDDLQIWEGDIVFPVLRSLSVLEDTEVVSEPYTIGVMAFDNQQLSSVDLKYSIDGGATVSLPMIGSGGGAYQGDIPAQVANTTVQYWVEASDGNIVSVAPDVGTNSFRVRLLAPLDLSGPDEVIHDDSVWLDWEAPESIHPLYSYSVYRSGVWVEYAYEPFINVELLGDSEDSFTVTVNYEVPSGEIVEGDHSNVWSVDAAVPSIISADPSVVYQGDTVHLKIIASNMLFVQGDVEFTVDSQIEVSSVDIQNVDNAIVTMKIPDNAMIGPRSVYAYSGNSNALLEEAFTVVSGDELPAIEQIVPNGLRQGQTEFVEFKLTAPIDVPPLVDLGPGVVIGLVELIAPDLVSASVTVEPTAPLGDRPVVLDDGVRSITGVSFDVRDQYVESVGCYTASSPHRHAIWLISMVFVAALLRRRIAPQ